MHTVHPLAELIRHARHEPEARSALEALPPSDAPEIRRRRSALRRFVAEVAALRGAPDELEEALYAEYLEGGSAKPWLRHVAGSHRCGPPGAEATAEAWAAVLQQLPEQARYGAIERAVVWLEERGADPDVIYLALARWGITPRLAALVERGAVSPWTVASTVEEHLQSPDGRGIMLARAALGALGRGDRAGAVCLVSAALRAGADPELMASVVGAEVEVAGVGVRERS